MKYTLYILKSLSTERLYIGQTSNFARRLKQHEDDRSYSTKGRGPWSVLKTIQLDTRSEAMKLEVKLKKMKNPVRIIAYVERHYWIFEEIWSSIEMKIDAVPSSAVF